MRSPVERETFRISMEDEVLSIIPRQIRRLRLRDDIRALTVVFGRCGPHVLRGLIHSDAFPPALWPYAPSRETLRCARPRPSCSILRRHAVRSLDTHGVTYLVVLRHPIRADEYRGTVVSAD